MLRVGLTGGIASGKSAVADLLAAKGAVIVDADVLAREVVEPGTPGLAAIVRRFGAGVLTAEGTLDRPALGAVIFSDDQARADLNAIVHPLVRARAAEQERSASPDDVVVHVIPLLVETGQQHDFDVLVVVDVDEETQRRRLMARNQLTSEQAAERLRAQASRAERLASADVVIDNSGDLPALRRVVDRLWLQLQATPSWASQGPLRVSGKPDSKENGMSHQPWMDRSLSPRERAESLVAAMSLEQKIAQLHGNMKTIDIYAVTNAITSEEDMEQLAAQIQIERHVIADDELGIPRMRITNGPVGVGMGDGTPSPPATALPMTIGVAASFDPEVAGAYGDVIGKECRHLGQHVLEGPGVCLHRTPTAGRNFEYFSEDPYLSGVMGVEVTQAIQGHGVIAMAKHYALNDQEVERFRNNVEIDEDVLRELYLLPFEMCVKDGHVASIMSAYNRVRGTYATESRFLLHDVLRRDWGFDGYVQSDFWSTRSCAASLGAGLDLEMPDAKWLNEDNVKAALHDTSLEIGTIERALVRRFTKMFEFGQFERPYEPTEIPAAEHGAVSRRLGQQMAVLLKNDDAVLPLSPEAGRVLIVGQKKYAEKATQGGGGSSKVDPLYTVDPLPGMMDVLADLGASASVELFVVADDLSNLDDAVAAARASDVVVIMAGLVATEGADMPVPSLPHDQDAMVAALLDAAATPVVVLKESAPMVLPWIDRAPTVLEVWNQGAEDGHVVAELLFGVVNPSGKVPTTYARRAEDLMAHGDPVRYPGTDEGEGYPVMRYTEGRQVGYRWFQSQGIEPLFPFGFGLSYTTFQLSDAVCSAPAWDGTSPVTVSVSVTNTGERAGAEVVQVYLGVPSAGQPPKRLVGFAKVPLEPGASSTVEITLDPGATSHPFGVWDVAAHDFVTVPGDYRVYVGTSSADDTFVFTLTAP